jgi:hypothetical protein
VLLRDEFLKKGKISELVFGPELKQNFKHHTCKESVAFFNAIKTGDLLKLKNLVKEDISLC